MRIYEISLIYDYSYSIIIRPSVIILKSASPLFLSPAYIFNYRFIRLSVCRFLKIHQMRHIFY